MIHYPIFTRIQQLKTWGLRGGLNFLKRTVEQRSLRKYFADNAKRHPLTPIAGLTLIADMTGTGSLSKTMRDLAFRLNEANIPFQTYDLHRGPISIPEEDYRDILTPPDEFHVLRYSHALEMCTNILPKIDPLKHARVYFWEFDSGLVEYDTSLTTFGTNVVVMSDFNQVLFRQALPQHVHVQKILYPFVFNVSDIPSPAETRKRHGFATDDFIVFFNFDFGTSYKRKNPEDALRAFAGAFALEPKAHFLFKTKNTKKHPDELANLNALAIQLGVSDRVKIIDDYLSMRDLYGLTNACDVYLSLHRGEGFGLGIAEAMSLGKPVIVTNYSAPTEFCTPQTSIPIPYEMVDVQLGEIDNPCYRAVKRWAQPDIAAASQSLRMLFENPVRRTQLGLAAKSFIDEYFSAENFKRSVMNYLKSRP